MGGRGRGGIDSFAAAFYLGILGFFGVEELWGCVFGIIGFMGGYLRWGWGGLGDYSCLFGFGRAW